MKRYAIIENEDYARENLSSYMKEFYPDYIEVFIGDTVAETLAWLRTSPEVDFLFMDIELNDGNCFEIFENFDLIIPVIFTTAYDIYLTRAFEANSIDYLLKPITSGALQKALLKFERLSNLNQNNAVIAKIGADRLKNNSERILLTKGDSYFYLNICEIAMFISEDKYVFAVTANGQRHITGLTSLKALLVKLDPDKFYLISRNCIVNISAIKYVKKYFGNKLKVGIIAGELEVVETVSSSRKRDFLGWFGISLGN